ncbi:MAG: ACP S-malonyltransferase [Frankia sp.]
MLAILAPGQGAQAPGQLQPWLELDGAAARLRWWSAAAGLDLVEAGTESDAETIRDTAVAQPLIVAAGLLAAEVLGLDLAAPGPTQSAVILAGHSVGEITVSVLAGILSPEAGVTFTAARGRAMAAAAALEPTGMSAVLGGDPDQVVAYLEAAGLTAANRNGAGQIVAAGPLGALAELAEKRPPKARVVPLSVAGAFHTHYMTPGRDALAAIAPGLRPGRPTVGLLSNADGTILTSGDEAIRRLVNQVASPVRWDLCLAALRNAGVTGVLELPPAGTLAGIARRELKEADIVALKTPDDLPAARDLIATHTGAVVVPTQVGDLTQVSR